MPLALQSVGIFVAVLALIGAACMLEIRLGEALRCRKTGQA